MTLGPLHEDGAAIPPAHVELDPQSAKPNRQKRWLQIPRWSHPWLSVLAILFVWEVLVRGGIVPEADVPPMSETFAELFKAAQRPELWLAIYNTLRGWMLGLAISVALAIPLGILIGSSRLLYRAVRVIVEFLRPVPSVALVPLAVLVFGTGLESKVFLAAFASFWPLFINTLYGVQNIDPMSIDTARAYRLGRLEIGWRVKLPSAVPYIATGVRTSSAVALILSVTAELVIGTPGLGRSINIARSGGALDLMYALIIVTGVVGWTLNALATQGERRVLHWHPSHQSSTR